MESSLYSFNTTKLIEELNQLKDDYKSKLLILKIGLIVIFVGSFAFLLMFSAFSDYKIEIKVGIILIGIFLGVLLVLMIHNYYKLEEVRKKKLEIIELDSIIKNMESEKKLQYIHAYLKKTILIEE